MDQNQSESLMEAAQIGDIQLLYRLLSRDSSVLDRTDQTDNPLHVAVWNNHMLFAAEIANLSPSLERSLNQHGLSPLHIAAENGEVDMVKKLLKVDKELCLIKGLDVIVPLNCASKYRDPRSEKVLKRFLSACPKCVTTLTTKNETALRTAIKSCSLQELGSTGEMDREAMGLQHSMLKDQEGNTILHLVTSEIKPEARRLLLLLLRNISDFVFL